MANIIIVGAREVHWSSGLRTATPAGLCTDIPALLNPAVMGFMQESTVVIPGGNFDRTWVYQRVVAAGYRTTPTEDGAWFTCWAKGKPTIHLCVLSWVDPTDPLIGWLAQPDPFDSEVAPSLYRALAWWQDKMGGHYRHTPGVAAHVSMKAMLRREQPQWNPYRDRGPLPGFEPPTQISPLMFRTTTIGRTRAGKAASASTVTYDTHKAYLAAMAGASLPMGPLTQTGPTPIGSGYVRITLPRSQWRSLDHDPLFKMWGIKADRQGCDWIGTATLGAINYLIGAPEVVDSWTAPGRRVLRSWAEKVRDNLDEDDPRGSKAPVLKSAYTQAVGLLAVRRGTIIRPDWRHLIIDYANAMMIHKTRIVYQDTGIVPLALDVDAVTYPDTPELRETVEDLFIGDHIGQWKEVTT